MSEGELRRPNNTLILWLKCDKAVHEQRLDARVDSMIEDGLIKELLDFHDKHNKHRIKDGMEKQNYANGIFQRLGFYEFADYILMSEKDRNSLKGKELLERSVENMKTNIKEYARAQNRIFSQSFIRHSYRQIPSIQLLNTTEQSDWNRDIKNEAIQFIKTHMQDNKCIDKFVKNKNMFKKKYYCKICNKYFLGNEYAIHLVSYKHIQKARYN